MPRNIIVGEFDRLDQSPDSLPGLVGIDQRQRDTVEEKVCRDLAERIMERLPRDDEQAQQLLEDGYESARQMDWSAVCEGMFLPAIERAYMRRRLRQIA